MEKINATLESKLNPVTEEKTEQTSAYLKETLIKEGKELDLDYLI